MREDWEDMILVTGASGSAGGAVLAARGTIEAPIRAMYRNARDADKAPDGVETVLADFADAASLRAALRDVDSVYLVCGPVPQLVQWETNMIDACIEADVRHIVLNSALGAGDYPKSFPAWHFQVEKTLSGSGLSHTVLRPNGFLQNIAAFNAESVRTDGAIYAAMGDARISMIDVRDVGAAAAVVLADPQPHEGKTYELNGPAAVSYSDIAEQISVVAARAVSYVDIPEETQRQAMLAQGVPSWQVTAVLELQEYYRSGRCAAVDGVTAKLLGRPQRTLEQYLEENATTFRSENP